MASPQVQSDKVLVNETDRAVLELVAERWQSSPLKVDISPMTPDASLRRYFRLTTSLSEYPTVVAVVYDSMAVPESGGGVTVNSFDAFISLSRFFKSHGIAVPELIFESKDPAVILLEDLGDVMLADVLLRGAPEEFQKQCIETYYRKAIDQIIHIQKIPADRKLFAYQRLFSGDTYIKEMYETLDYVLTPLNIGADRRSAVVGGINQLARELEEYPTLLVHRDFHSWNLMIDPTYNIRVIDFQDALLGTASYDVVGLLNDRDTDSALGDELYVKLVRYFASNWQAGYPFGEQYDRALLQRDLKVAGRFAKLVSQRGLMHYQEWIPGTLRRIGRTLERLVSQPGAKSSYLELLEVMSEAVKDVKVGTESPIRFS